MLPQKSEINIFLRNGYHVTHYLLSTLYELNLCNFNQLTLSFSFHPINPKYDKKIIKYNQILHIIKVYYQEIMIKKINYKAK